MFSDNLLTMTALRSVQQLVFDRLNLVLAMNSTNEAISIDSLSPDFGNHYFKSEALVLSAIN